MAKQEASVEELVRMIERGELRLPEMQRQYVWRSTRVRDLLDSLYRGYPSGVILLWETDEDVALRDFSVGQTENPYHRLLLDGQQRLTSLSAVIRGEPIRVGGRKRPIDILFNLNHPDHLAVNTEVNEGADTERLGDETDSADDEVQGRIDQMAFIVGTKKLEQTPQWVNVSEVFRSDQDAPFLARAGVERIDDPRYQKYSQRLGRLRNIRRYLYRMDVLERSLSYQEVTEIFVRVNSLGAKLRSSDLALAQITAKWRNSLKTFQEFQDRCGSDGFYLDLGIHLKNLIAMATGQSRFHTVNNIAVEKLQAAWKDACKGMEFALNFLKSNVGIDSPSLLSSLFMLITLAAYGHKRHYHLTPAEGEGLRSWARIANAKGRYSRGSSETLLDQDLSTVLRGGGADELIERLRLQVGRLDIVPEELDGRNQRSALFKTMFLAFRQAGARDWRSSLAIALDHSGHQHHLQFHHIFPKALLKPLFTDRETDDIANLAFIGGGTNRAISDKAPNEYIPELIRKIGSDPLTSQAIPTDPEWLRVEAYKNFLGERRRRVATAVNAYLGTNSNKMIQPVAQ
jgi:hypothetical protein